MSKPVGERFVQLVWETLRNPECADHRSELLAVASQFLDAIEPDASDFADEFRKVACLALDHAMFGGDATELKYATLVLAMQAKLSDFDKRISELEQ
ncbi:hypothetical protein [[Mycobacterium] crassicus]|uniref:Uncharacterized protein n=1 Tax=[Mycobacterium] crassicus TaxID=2872309 RepID=A0ABU5XNR2_9MYCO|nr:hypothetical protein [Mycolicibacter sp. MYC098]MEB3023917.1 hypothetical protein [Mycolicibacter sp. MYC098]